MMSLEKYRQLIEEFCETLEIDEVDTILKEGLIRIGEIPAKIEYFEAADQCRILVDLGQATPGYENEIYRMMLELNFDNASDCLPVLSIHPETSEIILALHLPLYRLESDLVLAEIVIENVESAVSAWNELMSDFRQGLNDEMIHQQTQEDQKIISASTPGLRG